MRINSFIKPWASTVIRLVATSKTVFILLLMALSFASAHFLSWSTATTYSGNSIPTPRFRVAISLGSEGKPFALASFEESHLYTCCLRLPKPYDSMTVNEFETQTYEVITSSPTDQLIEVAWLGESVHTWSRYRTTPDGLVPISFRILSPGHANSGVLIALVLLLFSRWVARLINDRKAGNPSDGKTA